MKRDSVASGQRRRPVAGSAAGGIEPTGKGGCCGVSDMLNASLGYTKNKGNAPVRNVAEARCGGPVGDARDGTPFGGMGR